MQGRSRQSGLECATWRSPGARTEAAWWPATGGAIPPVPFHADALRGTGSLTGGRNTVNSHVGHNKRMRARERGDYTRKKNTESEMRHFGQAVGRSTRDGGTWKRCQIVGGNRNQQNGGGCERVGQSGSPDGKARSLRRWCRWRVDWTEEANPNRPSEAVLIQIGWVDSFHRPPSPGLRSVPVVPKPT
jgi:hypothetical protein